MFELVKMYEKDPSEKKLNLIYGVCIDDNKRVYKFKVIQQVAEMLVNSGTLSHEYTTLTGLPELAPLATRVVFGEDNEVLDKVVAFQTCGATGALSLGGSLLSRYFKRNKVYIPAQTWEQHIEIFKNVGFEVRRYRYYNSMKQKVDFEGLMEDLKNADDDSAVILHANCHNPTGGILSQDQWKQIMCLLQERDLFPFFDNAYQGLGKDLVTDRWPVNTFAEAGMEFMVTQTFSKNFGLYGERVGFIYGVFNDPSTREDAMARFEYYGANTFLMTPAFGSKLVYEILRNEELRENWTKELYQYNDRMAKIKEAVKSNLEQKVNGRDFSFLVDNEGLFAWFNFTGNEAEKLRNQYNIYVLPNGRVNMSGLSLDDVEYFTDAMATVL
uniref:Aspartate aminotransferase, mitochondrial n=1 Tax=Callistoctopus minor TaxID=515824 RepID=A0A2S1FUH0_CALMC|nr:putative aspartate aminotransferase [Callistoctopus minor]